MLDLETAAPYAGRLGGERRHQRREKLIAYRNPFRAGDIILGIRDPGRWAPPKKPSFAAEPACVDSFCSPVDAPRQTCVRRIILGMNRSSGSERKKIITALLWILPSILDF